MGKVTASIDTSHYKGPITKSVTVTTNDPAGGAILLQVSAVVTSPLDVTPNDFPFIRTTVGDAKPTELTLAASDGQLFDVLGIDAEPALRATVRALPIAKPSIPAPKKPGPTRKPAARGSNRYLLTLTPKRDLPIGQATANVTVRTNLAKAETVPIRAVVVVTGPVAVFPEQLVIAPSASPPVLHVKLTKRKGSPLRILGVTSTDPDFTPTSSAVADGHEYDIVITYGGKPNRGPVNALITVKTTEPDQAAIHIPIRGRI